MTTRALILIVAFACATAGCWKRMDQSQFDRSSPSSDSTAAGIAGSTATGLETEMPSRTEDHRSAENEYSPQEVARRAFESVVYVYVETGGEGATQASGFVIGQGKVATNYHVVEGFRSGFVEPLQEGRRHRIQGVYVVDRSSDLAVVSVQGDVGPALSFGDSRGLQVGDPVYAVGNPKGMRGTFSDGIVSALREVDGHDLIQITAPVSEGSSGGPILNKEGRVIGIATAVLRDGQNINFAVPASALQGLLATSN